MIETIINEINIKIENKTGGHDDNDYKLLLKLFNSYLTLYKTEENKNIYSDEFRQHSYGVYDIIYKLFNDEDIEKEMKKDMEEYIKTNNAYEKKEEEFNYYKYKEFMKSLLYLKDSIHELDFDNVGEEFNKSVNIVEEYLNFFFEETEEFNSTLNEFYSKLDSINEKLDSLSIKFKLDEENNIKTLLVKKDDDLKK
tara:strand:- start:2031 stop:2618 length:588 start_codon:yes stop_codon:yes gene_type:complete